MRNRSSRVTALILLVIVCAVAAVYRAGWFDVSFIIRPAADVMGAETETEAEVGGIGTETIADTETDNDTEKDSDINKDTDTNDENVDGDEPPFDFVSVAVIDESYSRSYGEWVSDENWALASVELALPAYFSSTFRTASAVTYEMLENHSPYVPIYTEYTEEKPAVSLYMGYIIIETDIENIANIYSSDGELIGSYDETAITPAFCRDKENRPLFLYKDAYYYLDVKKGRFTQADYDPETESRGVNFDYTPDYGAPESDRKFIHTAETTYEYEPIKNKYDSEGYQLAYKIPITVDKYALASKYNTKLTDNIYYGAYNFSESRAAVIDDAGHLYYITKSGSVAIRSYVVRSDLTLGRRVYDFKMGPLTNGEESIGFYYFENGLARVRIMTLDRYRYDTYGRLYVVAEKDLLIYKDGDEFPVPAGYDIKAYSSGMILLEKDGKYGYMNHTGAWVVDPSLTYAEPFYEGLAVVGVGEERALIDKNGDYVIPLGEFEYIAHASTGVLAVYGEDAGWKVLYKMQREE